MNKTEIAALIQALPFMKPAEKLETLAMLEELERRERRKELQDDLLKFICHMVPDYKVGPHHRHLGKLLEAAARGEKDRFTVSIAPRMGKSYLTSTYFPAWFIGKFPNQKIMLVSHTTDLAVDFGRKVRNVVDSDAFREVFPGVTLAADSKSAGRWNTSHGGEFFACITPDTQVETQERGLCPAGSVKVGEHLLTHDGFVEVLERFDSTHEATLRFAGLSCSANHPIWVFGKGFVRADEVTSSDCLWVESISDKLKVQLRRVWNGRNLEYPHVPPLVQHQEPLRKPQKRKVSGLWRARHCVVRAVAGIREFLTGHGVSAYAGTHSGASEQQRTIQPGELRVGDADHASQQQAQQRSNWREDLGAACPGTWNHSRSSGLSFEEWARSTKSCQAAPEESGASHNPENFGWLRNTAARLLASCGRGSQPREPRGRMERYLARIGETAQVVCGLLLGVRCAGIIHTETHNPRPFVNYHVAGDNTFIANGILTHNCGVGSALAGRGADLLIIDDPHSEQDILAGNYDVFEKAYQWYAFGARTRLMPGGRVAVIATRWSPDDLIGRLQKDSQNNPDADQWEVVEFPAILPSGKALWPEFWPLDALERTRASMPFHQWSAQYLQQPTAEEGALIKREWWQKWTKERPPTPEYILISYDTAFEANQRADYSACTIWGAWTNEEDNNNMHIILLNAWKKRLEFPELKLAVLDDYKEWEPDGIIVEKKASGAPLIYELRSMGISVQEFTPSKGQDKVARVNAVSDLFASGRIWVPETRWAEEVIEEIAGFPSMKHDDYVDSTTQAMLRLRRGGLVKSAKDEEPEPQFWRPKRKGYY